MTTPKQLDRELIRIKKRAEKLLLGKTAYPMVGSLFNREGKIAAVCIYNVIHVRLDIPQKRNGDLLHTNAADRFYKLAEVKIRS